jgi:Tol biopolymer transport system component
MSPLALDHVVKTCMAKEPDARWQTAHYVLVELKWIAAAGEAGQVTERAALLRFRKRAWVGWVVATCLLVALMASWAMVYLRPAVESRLVQFEVTPGDKAISADSILPVVSPDGQRVAFAYGSGEHSRIWLHSLNSMVTIPLPGTEGVDSGWIAWSPDGGQIAFSTTSALKKISITGGMPQTICNLATGSMAWNRENVIIFSQLGQPLSKVSAAGGEPKPLTRLDQTRQETNHEAPRFLPDGRHFTYLAVSKKPENTATYVGSMDSPDVKRIQDGNGNVSYAPPGYLIFERGQSLMAQRFDVRKAELSGDPMLLVDSMAYGLFWVSENGVLTYFSGSGDLQRTQLVGFDRDGKRLGTAGEPAVYTNPAISPDQKKIAVGKLDLQTKTRDIWVIDLQRGTPSRFTFDPGDDLDPGWSPDATRIAFTSDRKGHRDIYLKLANGAGEEQMLLQSEGNKLVEDWSSDGQYLLWGTNTELCLFSFREHKSLPLPKFTQDQGRFCPSGSGPPRWVAYTSYERGQQVYVRSLAGALPGSGGTWQISTSGGSEPMWRGDGKELFFLNDNRLMAVEVNGDREAFQFGIPKKLFEARLTPVQRRNRYVVTSDGKRFLMNVPAEEQERTSFRVVLNWPALLKR